MAKCFFTVFRLISVYILLVNTVVRWKKYFSLHLKLVISVFCENGSINEAMREKDSKKRESFTIEYPQS